MKKIPIYLLYIYVFLLPLDSVLVISGESSGATYTRLFSVFIVVFACLYFMICKVRISFNRGILATSFFIVYCLISSLWAIDAQAAILRIPVALSLLSLYLVVILYPITQAEYIKATYFYVFGSCLASLYMFKIFILDDVNFVVGRASLVFQNRATDPNQFAFSLLLPFALALQLAFSSESKSIRNLSFVSSALLISGIILTGSRGGALGAFVIFSYLFFSVYTIKRAVFFVAITIVVSSSFVGLLQERFGSSLATGGAGRINIWNIGYEAFFANPIFGSGVSNFPIIYDYFRYLDPELGFGRGAHNIFIGTLVELGVVGFLLLITMLVTHYNQLSNVKKEFSLPLKAAFFGVLAQSMFLDVIWRKSFWILFVFIGINYALSSRKDHYV